MKRDYIKIGSEISTMEGKIIVTGYNGHICTCDEFIWNDETEESDIPNGYRNLTLDEIGKEMKYLDGQNHKVIFESEEEYDDQRITRTLQHVTVKICRGHRGPVPDPAGLGFRQTHTAGVHCRPDHV